MPSTTGLTYLPTRISATLAVDEDVASLLVLGFAPPPDSPFPILAAYASCS